MHASEGTSGSRMANSGGFDRVPTDFVLMLGTPRDELPFVRCYLQLIRDVLTPRSCLGARWRLGNRRVST